MKIGINLVGISYLPDKVDWRYTRKNIKCNIIDCWGENSVITNITTYYSITIFELIDFYNPKKYTILDFKNSDQRLTYIHSLLSWLNEDVDFIVSTRYDIFFHKKACDYIIDYNKINFLFREKDYWQYDKFVTDNFFIIPKKFLLQFINSIYYMYFNPYRKGLTDLHAIYSTLLKKLDENDMNIISEKHENSYTNSHYKLIRSNEWKDFNIT